MISTAELADVLRRMHIEQDEKLRSEYNRSVPFADGLFDRWERAQRLGFGEDTSIYNSAIVIGEVHVGKHTWIGPNVFLEARYGPITIGDYCSISAGSAIYSHDSVMWSLSGGKKEKRTGSIVIEDNCYIGSQVIIGPNVRVGRQSVVATNSFVNEIVPAQTIVGGSPARVIGSVVEDGDDIHLEFDSGSVRSA